MAVSLAARHARLALGRLLPASIFLLDLLTCSPNPERPETWQLESGQTLASLARDGRPAAVLLLDPGDWFVCSNIIAEWLYWKQREGGNLHIVLTSHPTRSQRAILASGLRWDHVLRRSVSGTPRELVFIGDSLVYHRRVLLRYATTPLLDALRESTLPRAIAVAKARSVSIVPQPLTKESRP